MKIVMLSPQEIVPPNDGGRRRSYDLAAQLSQEHQVVLVCPRLTHPEPEGLPFRIRDIGEPGRLQQIFDPRFAWRLRRLLREEAPDLIVLELIWQGLQTIIARFPRRTSIVLDAHNAEGARFKGAGSRWWRLIALYERFVLRLVDRVLFVSEYDLRHLRRAGLAPGKAQYAPNGYDERRFHPDAEAGASARRSLGLNDDEALLLFFGHLGYQPNVDGIELLHEHVLPLLDASGLRYRLIVAGKGPVGELKRRFSNPRVMFVGDCDPIQDLINAADVVVAPMLRGGNTRVRVMETIGCGKPIVCIAASAEGMDRDACGDRLLVADDWAGFAEAIQRCVRCPRPVHVPPAFRAKYEWSAIVGGIHLDGR